MIEGFAHIELGSYRLPRWLATLLGLATAALGFYLVFSVLLGQADAVAAAWPRYVARFEAIVSDLTEWLGPERSAKVKEMLAAIDLTRQIPGLISSTQSIVTNLLIGLAYVAFLFAESGYMSRKLAAMFPGRAERKIRRTS